MVGSLASPEFLACPNVRCNHEPEYDSSVNETYCILCLERLPNVPKVPKVGWWMRQHIVVRALVYVLVGLSIGTLIGSFVDG